MMKKRTLSFLLAALMLAALLSGCGRAAGSSYAAAEEAAPAGQAYFSAPAAAYDYDYEDFAYEDAYDEWSDGAAAAMPVPAPAAANLSAEVSAEQTQNPQKLIYTADLNMETLAFDEAVEELTRLTAACGGYFESSSVSDQSAYRWASYTIRVPAENYRTFLDQAGETCHVLSIREYTEDVSESYYDTAGRLETQRTKLSRLQELLLQAEDMEDIIVLEDAISETEEAIDRLSGTLRHYDALVSYSTVSVYLEEVKVYEPEPDPTYGARLGSAFTEGLKGFAQGLGDILVALAYSWLWLVLIAAIVVLILWLTRKRRAARRERREERKAAAAARKTEAPQYSLPTDAETDEKE